jgi:hypothetical protein|tara:strand:- start:873 stop:2090 length:1218 start_codon:yes stop_codon:yes gene_type:complete
LISLLIGPGTPTRAASPGAELKSIVADCRAEKASCEEALWKFIDVSADDRLTVAEISRFFRFLIGDQDRPPEQSSANDGLLASVIGGPLGARVFIKNFDYDGDGRVAREEFYQDADGAGMRPLLVRLRQAFEQIAGQATALAGTVMPGAKKPAGAAAPAPPPAPVAAPTAAEDPSNPHGAAFLRLAGQCWQAISSAGETQMPVITFRVDLKTNGFLARNPWRRSRHSREVQASHLYGITKKRGLAAIADCQPYELPLEDYERWKEFDVSFGPQGLRRVTPPPTKASRKKIAKKRKGVPVRHRVKKPSPEIIRSFDKQLGRCWKRNPKPTGVVTALILFRLQLDEDGHLERTKMLASHNKVPGWEGVRDAAKKAFAMCQPYELPSDLYREWQIIEIELWPTGFRSF